MISLNALMEAKSAQFEAMNERERYVFLLLFQYRNPYRWGKELPNGADCSGAVCFALIGTTGSTEIALRKAAKLSMWPAWCRKAS